MAGDDEDTLCYPTICMFVYAAVCGRERPRQQKRKQLQVVPVTPDSSRSFLHPPPSTLHLLIGSASWELARLDTTLPDLISPTYTPRCSPLSAGLLRCKCNLQTTHHPLTSTNLTCVLGLSLHTNEACMKHGSLVSSLFCQGLD